MSKILFFNAPVRRNIYLSTNVRVGAPDYPSLTLATLAGNLTGTHEVKIIDLELINDPQGYLINEVKSFNPDVVAASANTSAYFIVKDIMRMIKDRFPHIKTIIGGVHVTALPEEVSREECFDIVVVGEGDTVIPELLASSSLKDIPGIAYYDSSNDKRMYSAKRGLIRDLNALPYPAWHLFSLNKY